MEDLHNFKTESVGNFVEKNNNNGKDKIKYLVCKDIQKSKEIVNESVG